MKYAVIGAETFIGSRIVEALHLGDGESIVAVSAQASEHTLAARFSADLRVADFGSAESLATAIDRCSVAIHAVPGEDAQLKRFATAFARAGAAGGVRRLVYVSSLPTSAATTANGTDASDADVVVIGEAQAAAERQFQAECRRAGVAGIALRTAVVYGPRCPLVDEIATELSEDRAWLLNSGLGVFNGIYIDNLVAAVRLCLKCKAQVTEALTVADAETITWRDFYHQVAHELELSASRIRSVDSIAALLRDIEASPSLVRRASLQHEATKIPFAAAAKLLGYAPPVGFAEGVQRSCAWWRFAHGHFRASPAPAS